MFNMDAPYTFHIRKVSPSVLGCLLCPSQYKPSISSAMIITSLGAPIADLDLEELEE
jgi:hypothetical protein